MKKNILLFMAVLAAIVFSCTTPEQTKETAENQTDTIPVADPDTFAYQTEQFGDVRILRYKVPGFEELSTNHKILLYCLSQAGLSGRDIIWDQNYKHNLCIRRTLEAIVNSYKGDKKTEDYKKFMVYTKKVWFSNGIHHHYSNLKIMPEFPEAYFAELVKNSDAKLLPLQKGETADALIKKLTPVIFDPTVAPKKVVLDPNTDMLKASATNFYEGVTQKEAEDFYAKMNIKGDSTPPSYGLNSKLLMQGGKITEKIWKEGGMYDEAVKKIIYWLDKSLEYTENDNQKEALQKLIQYHKTGDLKTFDEYNIAWVKDINSMVDVVNGYIEVYADPLGMKGSYESVVSFKDLQATKRIETIGNSAQWFEDNSPIAEEHKKKNVTGISAKVITVVSEAGDASPSTPIGINLPNSNWIRAKHGSKSVNLGNIVHSYEQSSKSTGILEEFYYSEVEMKRAREHGDYSDKLHTDMHEVIGHASGQINQGVGQPHETLKNYASALEEARADLVALYYLMDPKLIQLGVMKTLETGKAAYDDYITNGLLIQLSRLNPGEDLEEAHMRNRQLVAAWTYQKGAQEKVIEKKVKDGKTFFVINDYEKLRVLFGELLKEIQRIKSEGDYLAGKKLIETYGVKVDQAIHAEVLERYKKLNIAPYRGFINPRLVAHKNEYDKIINITIEYPMSFTYQMLEYAREYSFLPTYN